MLIVMLIWLGTFGLGLLLVRFALRDPRLPVGLRKTARSLKIVIALFHLFLACLSFLVLDTSWYFKKPVVESVAALPTGRGEWGVVHGTLSDSSALADETRGYVVYREFEAGGRSEQGEEKWYAGGDNVVVVWSDQTRVTFPGLTQQRPLWSWNWHALHQTLYLGRGDEVWAAGFIKRSGEEVLVDSPFLFRGTRQEFEGSTFYRWALMSRYLSVAVGILCAISGLYFLFALSGLEEK